MVNCIISGAAHIFLNTELIETLLWYLAWTLGRISAMVAVYRDKRADSIIKSAPDMHLRGRRNQWAEMSVVRV